MAWPVLQYSKSQVDRAGEVLASTAHSETERDEALEVLNNWRAAHNFPLNTMQMGLRQGARAIYQHALIAQRIKRIPSIVQKLRRFPRMQLSQMQDIGGCRAVVETVRQVRALDDRYKGSRQRHELAKKKDYITEPKDSGYRGIHLVYRYRSDRTARHNGRQIEIQLRSKLQHAWATAVETVGVFLDEALKSSEGSADWLRFFSLAGSAFAHQERAPLVPGTPVSLVELRDSIRRLWCNLDVPRRLEAYGSALRVHEDSPRGKAYYFFLLHLMPSVDVESRLMITAFPKDSLDEATENYLRVEKALPDAPGSQAVLVASDSMAALRRAYPNYFLDTQVFARELAVFLARKLPVRKPRSHPKLPFGHAPSAPS